MYTVIPAGRPPIQGRGDDPTVCFDSRSYMVRIAMFHRGSTYLLIYDENAWNQGAIRNMIGERIARVAGKTNAVIYGLCTLQKWTYNSRKNTVTEDRAIDDIRDLTRG